MRILLSPAVILPAVLLVLLLVTYGPPIRRRYRHWRYADPVIDGRIKSTSVWNDDETIVLQGSQLKVGKPKHRPGMETMDEERRDRASAKRKAIADALERRRQELETGLVHVPGGRVSPFSRTREGSDAREKERRA